jgi:hypothetical protein
MTAKTLTRRLILSLALCSALGASAVVPAHGQHDDRAAAVRGGLRLADIMQAVQWRHVKLWFAAKSANWDLAQFQTRQIKARLEEAANLYQNLPLTEVTTMAQPLEALSEAIAAKDNRAFAKAYVELTAGCNSCHRTIKLDFIAIKTPAVNPFEDQEFAPVRKK